jgi:hypothetical protein
VVPNTLLGILVFLAAVGPGYVYVRVADQWRPPIERSPLREAAELVVIGSVATTVAVVVALIIGDTTGLLDTARLAERPGTYLVTQPMRTGVSLAIVVLLSYGGAWLAANRFHGGGVKVYPDSAWYGAFERDLPTGYGIYATVELHDGRLITGAVRSFTAEPVPVDQREITLHAPYGAKLLVRSSGARDFEEISDAFILLKGSEVRYISARYRPLVESA